MLLSEFITRTGYQPTADEYAEIENEYNNFKGDKDAFCRAWKRVNPTKAGQIERARKKAERTEKVFQIALKEVRNYKGDDPWADTSLCDVYDITEKKKVTAEELATACNKLYEYGHTFGLDCNQFNRARLLRNYAKKAHIGTETSAEELARTLLHEENLADVVTITEQETGKIVGEIYKIY